MKKTLLAGSLLLAPSLIYAQEVQAEENIENRQSSFTATLQLFKPPKMKELF